MGAAPVPGGEPRPVHLTPFFVGLNAAYVVDFLSATDTPSVSLDLKDENSQCIGRPATLAEDLPYDYLYVVMPMRI